MMGRLTKSAAAIAAALFALASCSKEPAEHVNALPIPKVVVNDITATSFSVSWDVVTDAGSFTYIFNGEEEKTTTDRRLSFENLEPAVEYSFSIKTNAGINKGWKDSEYLTLKITTEGESQLDSPEPQVLAAYISKTIINWKAIPGATSYEYSVGSMSGTVTQCSVELAGFEGETEYEFSVKAVSTDPHVKTSEPGAVKFKTRPSSDDIPQLILDVNEVGCDYVDFNVYAVPDARYLFFAVPQVYFNGHSEKQIMETYRDYVLEAIESQGYTLEAGIDLYASYGSSNYLETNVYPEMSYYIIAFGIDKVGNIETSLYKTPVKTLANGGYDGPHVVGADWFSQSLFYYQFGGYNPTNCLGFNWKGVDIVKTKYIMTSTYSFRHYFESSEDLLRKYVTRQGTEVESESVIQSVNSADGYSYRYALGSATAYTLATIAINSASDTTFVVNSLGTKASTSFYDWAFLTLGTSSKYDAKTALAATVSFSYDKAEKLNIQLSEVSYLLKPSDQIEDMTTAQASALVASEGTVMTGVQMSTLNMTGSVSLSFGTDGNPLVPGTKYTLLVNITTVNGDKIFRSRTASTEADSSSDANTETKSLGGRHNALMELNPGEIIDLYNF